MNTVCRWSLRLLVSSVVLFALVQPAAASGERYSTNSIKIELRTGLDPAKTAALITQGIGKITVLNGSTVIITLDEGVNLARAIKVTQTRPSVISVESVLPKAPIDLHDITSVSQLKEAIKQYREAFEQHVAIVGRDAVETEDDDPPGLDYLGAQLQFMELRAYPLDEIDMFGYEDVLRSRLPGFLQRTRDRQGISVQLGNWQDNRSFGPAADWEYVGPTNLNIPYRTYYGVRPINGRINGVAYDPNDSNTFYIGAAQGGVWKTTDGGTNWTTFGDDWPAMHIGAIAVDPTDGQTVYAGTGDFHGSRGSGWGVLKSTDGGATWIPKGASVQGSSRTSEIIVHPDHPNIVMVSTGRGSGEVMVSTDFGETWTKKLSGGNWSDLSIGAQDGSGQRTAWAVGNSNRVYKSTDDGASWTQITTVPFAGSNSVLSVAASVVFSDTAYVLAPSGDDRLYKTTDGGATWANITAGMPTGYFWSQGSYNFYVGTSSVTVGAVTSDAVYVGIISCALSIDGGATFRQIGGGNWTSTYTNRATVHNDQHSFAVNPSDPNEVMLGNDGGLYRFTYDPANDTYTHDQLNRNLGITQFYRIAPHPASPDWLLGGTQDNASPLSKNDLGNWENPGAGDGAGCAISPTNPAIQYNSWQFQGIIQTLNNWTNDQNITPNWSGHSRPFIGKLRIDPNSGNFLYANTNYLNRFDIPNQTWTLKVGGIRLTTSGRVNEIAIAPGDSNRIYAGSTDAELWMSSDFGANWIRVDDSQKDGGSGLPNRAITTISINPLDKNDVLVGLSGTNADHLWRCFDVTLATPLWVSVSGSGANSLPNVSLNALARDLADDQATWYAATDVGVYMTADSGSSWADITQTRGLPNVQVNDITAVPGTGFLNAGTYGRGWWRLRIQDPVPELLAIVVDPASVVGGQSTTGTLLLTAPAPDGGMQINLLTINNLVTVPAQVTVSEGATSANFSIDTLPVRRPSSTIIAAIEGTNYRSARLDLLTAPDTGPFSVSVVTGVWLGGDVSSVQTSDDLYYAVRNAGNTILTEYVAALFNVGAAGMRLDIEAGTTHSSVTRTIFAYNYTTNVWDIVETGAAPLPDTTITVALSANYADPTTGEVKVRLMFTHPLPPFGGFVQGVDYVHWTKN